MQGVRTMQFAGVEIPMSNTAAWVGTVVGILAVAWLVFFQLYSKIKLGRQSDASEVGALRLMDAAILHWKQLNDEAWAQVRKERDLRIEAERRSDLQLQEMEALRQEVMQLRGEVNRLRSVIVLNTQSPPDGGNHAPT